MFLFYLKYNNSKINLNQLELTFDFMGAITKILEILVFFYKLFFFAHVVACFWYLIKLSLKYF